MKKNVTATKLQLLFAGTAAATVLALAGCADGEDEQYSSAPDPIPPQAVSDEELSDSNEQPLGGTSELETGADPSPDGLARSSAEQPISAQPGVRPSVVTPTAPIDHTALVEPDDLADAIRDELRNSELEMDAEELAEIDVEIEDGVVILSGKAPDADAIQKIISIVEAMPVVDRVENRLSS